MSFQRLLRRIPAGTQQAAAAATAAGITAIASSSTAAEARAPQVTQINSVVQAGKQTDEDLLLVDFQNGDIQFTQLELREAADDLRNVVGSVPIIEEPEDQDSMDSGDGGADDLIQNTRVVRQDPMAVAFGAAERLVQDHDVQQAIMKKFKEDAELRSIIEQFHAQGRPRPLALPPAEAAAMEEDDMENPLLMALQQIASALQNLGEKVGNQVVRLGGWIRSKLHAKTKGDDDDDDSPTVGDGVVGGLMLLGAVIVVVAVLKRGGLRLF